MKRMKLVSILVCAFAIGLISCSKTAKTDAKAVEIPIVKLQPSTEREVEQSYELTASVQPQDKNSIAPSAPGRIRQILVEVGQHVVKGQKIVQMDVANLSNLEAQVDNYKKSYKRIQELYNVGGASQQDLENVKIQLDVAQTNLKNLNENTFLLSPINGVVTERNYDSGDMYSAQRPVLVVMNINPVKLVLNVSESYYAQVKVGMPVKINFDVIGNDKFPGKVSLIYPTIDDHTRTFAVEVKVSNNNNKIRPGMFGRVKLEFPKVKRILVPDKAIVKQAGSGAKYVFIYIDGKVQYKQVEIGRRVDDEYEILSGINAGEQVVIAGQSNLVDGTSVNVVK